MIVTVCLGMNSMPREKRIWFDWGGDCEKEEKGYDVDANQPPLPTRRVCKEKGYNDVMGGFIELGQLLQPYKLIPYTVTYFHGTGILLLNKVT